MVDLRQERHPGADRRRQGATWVDLRQDPADDLSRFNNCELHLQGFGFEALLRKPP
jgi:hypothetical protein